MVILGKPLKFFLVFQALNASSGRSSNDMGQLLYDLHYAHGKLLYDLHHAHGKLLYYLHHAHGKL